MHNKKSTIVIFIAMIIVLSSFALIFNLSNNNVHGINNKSSVNSGKVNTGLNKNNTASQVNPAGAYNNEPAPMGLADYGIGYNNTPYKYNTTSFFGSAKINSISVINNTTGSNSMTFQFNINLVFYNGNTKYVYWVQDVAYVNTSSRAIAFIDNIWNMSSSGANMYNSTVAGNGTVGNSSGTHFYYSCAASTLTGNDINLTYPATIHFMVNSTVKNGLPELNIMYNDGYGWVTYDNPIFKFAKNITADYGFVVDGYNYEPGGLFYDAELILGGPGGGSSTVDLKSNVNLSIKYWNNHNYQEISNAYNYGSNTAETISNVTSNARCYISNGSIFENIKSGDGSLSKVYTSNNVSLLNISMPFSNGSVYINGTEHEFVNNGINLTIAPGKYNVKIYNGTTLYKTLNVSLSAGEYLPLNVAKKYNVTFTETGLLPKLLSPPVVWYVNLSNGQSFKSINSTITFIEANGTYSYTISTANKIYSSLSLSGSFTVNGTSVSKNVSFSKVIYNVTFKETGLPSGTTWYVNLTDGRSYRSTNSTITFTEANGTYKFTVSADLSYISNIASGKFHVNGSNATKSIAFSRSSGTSIIDIITLTGVVAVAVGSAAFVIFRKKK